MIKGLVLGTYELGLGLEVLALTTSLSPTRLSINHRPNLCMIQNRPSISYRPNDMPLETWSLTRLIVAGAVDVVELLACICRWCWSSLSSSECGRRTARSASSSKSCLTQTTSSVCVRTSTSAESAANGVSKKNSLLSFSFCSGHRRCCCGCRRTD